jgi:plastocyanin
LRARERVGVSRVALVAVLVVVVAIAGVAAYFALTPSAPSTSTHVSSSSSTSSSTAASSDVTVAVVPPSPLISPGQTQNYSLIQVSAAGSGPGGSVTVRAFTPAGLSLVLNQTSVSLSENQSIPVMLKAAPGLSPGNYSVTIETSSNTIPAKNQTFDVQVVPMLVIMQDFAFHPQNITVAKGTRVTWLNLDSNIGCCDPGEHDVSFSSGENATSPLLSTFESWSYTFGNVGVAGYYCTIHLFMKGQVTVTG